MIERCQSVCRPNETSRIYEVEVLNLDRSFSLQGCGLLVRKMIMVQVSVREFVTYLSQFLLRAGLLRLISK